MISSLWAIRSSWARSKGIDILEILIAMTVIYLNCQGEQCVNDLLRIIMYACYAVVIYAVLYYGVRNILDLLSSSVRIPNEAINANQLGLCAAYAIIINLYYILYGKLKGRDILILPYLILLDMSGSRKAIVLLGAGIIFLFVLKNWNTEKKARSALRILLILGLLALLLVIVINLPAFSNLKSRMYDLINIVANDDYNRNNSAWIRLEYNKLGIELFKSHPLLGIGIGSANVYTSQFYGHDHFLHNNIIEMLACGGIIGFLLYYSIYFLILARFIRYRKSRDKEYDICLVLLILTLVMDYGMISYLEKSTYLFLLLFWIKSVQLKTGKQ